MALIALALAPAAMGQSSSVDTYGGQGGEVAVLAASGGGGGSDPGSTSSSGSLPFTGLDIGYLIGGGLLVLIAGATMARVVPSGSRS